jgi:uncharacterized protein
VSGAARAAPAAALVAALLLACRPPPPPPPPPEARVHVDASAGTATVRVEIARTPREQEKGLMDRAQLDADAGMIFPFATTGRHAFWMKNTILPLDLLFIGEDGRVAAIVERSPLGLDSDDGGVESRYVLEVNRGWARAHGVKPGDRVRLQNVLY